MLSANENCLAVNKIVFVALFSNTAGRKSITKTSV